VASGRIHGNPEATLAVSRHVGHVNRETFKSPRRALYDQVDCFRVSKQKDRCVKTPHHR
jgi:hypothetical protein